MERRRKAFGLKKSSTTPEKNPMTTKISVRRPSTSGEKASGSNSRYEEKNMARGKLSPKIQTAGSVTPKQKTQVQAESPRSPLQSPVALMLFPGTIASPEIEVSWDWSCSQVPKDMLPPKKPKQKQDTKAQLANLPTINMFHRPWPPRQRDITEEENQRRLEYYKNILALKSPESSSDVLYDSTNNNVEEVPVDYTNSFGTPKRPTTRLSSALKKKSEDNSLFDDSANELMIECSQAIEEKLRNGEIDMGPIVDIQISQQKRHHSPGIENDILHKKSCHGRVNLFPEQKIPGHNHPKNELKLNTSFEKDLANNPSGGSTFKNQNALNVIQIERRVSQNSANTNCQNIRPDISEQKARSINNPYSKIHSGSIQANCTNKLQPHVNTINLNIADKVCKPQNSSMYHNNHSISLKTQCSDVNVLRNQQNMKQVNCISNKVEETKKPKCNGSVQENVTDLMSLLDDDFDLELSNLDVDSLCRDSEPKNKQVATSAPKLCTQQEIEAKRQAALQKLRLKRNKI